MLLTRGEPDDWGVGGTPTVLGFASEAGAYELDIDKVTRLNPSNAYALNYSQLWVALGIGDVSFRLEVGMLFNLTLSLSSSQHQGENTTYTFKASTHRQGYPLPAEIKYHLVLGSFNTSNTGKTGIDGSGVIEFPISNSLNGTALLVGFAQVEESIVSCSVLKFAHNSEPPQPTGSFATLSPLNYSLNVDLVEGATVVNAAVLSKNYVLKLTGSGATYRIPRLLDSSPMVLVLTGINGSSYWAEWTTYPQIPLAVGAEMNSDQAIMDVTSISYLVEVNRALYRYDILFGSSG
jgi:hypothetical protein